MPLTQKFQPFPILYTQRLVLRQLCADDAIEILYLRTNEDLNRYIEKPSTRTKADAIYFIDKINQGITTGKWVYWGMCQGNTEQVIGTLCLWNFSEDGKTAEAGYALHQHHQGQGLMTEAMKAMLTYGYNKQDLNVIQAFTHPDNLRSLNLLKKLGFQRDLAAEKDFAEKQPPMPEIIFRMDKDGFDKHAAS